MSLSMNNRIPGDAEFLSPDAGGGFRANGAYWQSQPFKLRNPRIAEMAQIIQGSGLGTLDDAYQLLIPPLSTHGRLPLVGIEALIELTRAKARPYEQLERWDKAAEVYQWLLRTSQAYQAQPGHIRCLLHCRSCESVWDSKYRAMAVFIDFLREITLADEISGSENQSLEEARLLLETELEDPQYRFFKDASSEFGTLYERQSRQ